MEEQFYLLWPLVMIGLIAPRPAPAARDEPVAVPRRRRSSPSSSALLYYPGPIETLRGDAGRLLAGRRPLHLARPTRCTSSTPTRATGLLLGAAFAMVWRPVALHARADARQGPAARRRRRRRPRRARACCAGTCTSSPPDGADPWLFRGGFFVTGIATLIVIAAVTHRGSRAGRLLGNPVLLWIGTRSLRAVPVPLADLPDHARRGRAPAVGRPVRGRRWRSPSSSPRSPSASSRRRSARGQVGRWWRRLQAARDPAPRRLIAGAGAGARRPVGVRRGQPGDRRAQAERDRPVAGRGRGRGHRTSTTSASTDDHRRAGDRRVAGDRPTAASTGSPRPATRPRS